MRTTRWLCLVVACCGLWGSHAEADDKVTTKFAPKIQPAGPVKAYTGPEAELVLMLEINDGKEILVQPRNVGGGIDGTTSRYLLEDLGEGNKNVYVDAKRGSKPYRRVAASARDNHWTFFHPTKPGTQFDLHYSEAVSEKLKPEDVTKAYHP